MMPFKTGPQIKNNTDTIQRTANDDEGDDIRWHIRKETFTTY